MLEEIRNWRNAQLKELIYFQLCFINYHKLEPFLSQRYLSRMRKRYAFIAGFIIFQSLVNPSHVECKSQNMPPPTPPPLFSHFSEGGRVVR